MNDNTLKAKIYKSNVRHKKGLSMIDIETSSSSSTPSSPPTPASSPIIVRSSDSRSSPMKLPQRSPSSIALENACKDVCKDVYVPELKGYKKVFMSEQGFVVQRTLIDKVNEKKIEIALLKVKLIQRNLNQNQKELLKEIFNKYYYNRYVSLLDKFTKNKIDYREIIRYKDEVYGSKFDIVQKYTYEYPTNQDNLFELMNDYIEYIDNIRYVLEYKHEKTMRLVFSINYLKEQNSLLDEEIKDLKQLLN